MSIEIGTLKFFGIDQEWSIISVDFICGGMFISARGKTEKDIPAGSYGITLFGVDALEIVYWPDAISMPYVPENTPFQFSLKLTFSGGNTQIYIENERTTNG